MADNDDDEEVVEQQIEEPPSRLMSRLREINQQNEEFATTTQFFVTRRVAKAVENNIVSNKLVKQLLDLESQAFVAGLCCDPVAPLEDTDARVEPEEINKIRHSIRRVDDYLSAVQQENDAQPDSEEAVRAENMLNNFLYPNPDVGNGLVNLCTERNATAYAAGCSILRKSLPQKYVYSSGSSALVNQVEGLKNGGFIPRNCVVEKAQVFAYENSSGLQLTDPTEIISIQSGRKYKTTADLLTVTINEKPI